MVRFCSLQSLFGLLRTNPLTHIYIIVKRPLEVIGHDGKAVNVTMEPGDLVLYESHSILHGVSGVDLQERCFEYNILTFFLFWTAPISTQGTIHGQCLYSL